MADVTLEQIVQMIAHLSPEDRNLLVHGLKSDMPIISETRISRETILAEHARRLAAGAFDHVESMFGRYAKPGLDPSFEDIEAAIHEHSWEDELDEFSNDDPA